MKKALMFLSLLLITACSATPSGTPAPTQSATPASASPTPVSSATPQPASTPTASPAAPAASGQRTLAGLKAAVACLMAAGSNGKIVAEGLGMRITLAETILQQPGQEAIAQGQVDLGWSQGELLETKFGLDCLK